MRTSFNSISKSDFMASTCESIPTRYLATNNCFLFDSTLDSSLTIAWIYTDSDLYLAQLLIACHKKTYNELD